MVARGPQIPIDISLPQNLVQQLSQQGQQIPTPISGHALVDTGASISAVDISIIRRLNLHSVGVVTIGTAGGARGDAMRLSGPEGPLAAVCAPLQRPVESVKGGLFENGTK